MAEVLQSYDFKIGFDDALKKLSKLRTSQKKMNQMQENSLKRQINLQKRLNSLKGAGIQPTGRVPSMPRSVPQQAQSGGGSTQRQRLAQANAIKQLKQDHILLTKKELSTEEQLLKKEMKRRVLEAKSAADVRKAGVWANKRLRAMNAQTKQLQKQNFILQRMQSSSKQFAGNMVSAFAIATGVSGVVRIGQDFEAVNNTMLAVSADSEQAGENFQFVRDEAFRLGLGLKESAKGFAKMVAARGDMSLEDTKAAFTGISEMGTLLGLSAEEGSRAINALQQMMSKGVVSAEELNFRLTV